MILKEVQTLTGHQGRVWNCAFSPNGTLLATCGEDKNIRIWGQEGDKWVTKTILTDGHTRTVRGLGWSACSKFLASASFDGTVAIWDRKSGQFECNASLEGHENEVKCVSWARSGQYLATCSRDKSVWVWEVDEEEDEYMCASVLQAHSQDVKKVRWHPHMDILASCSYDNKIKLFCEDDDDWRCFATMLGHENTVWAISFNAAGDSLASVSEDGTLRVWQEFKPGNKEGIATKDNDSTWKCVSTVQGYHDRAIYDVDWCHQTDLIATASGDDGIRIFSKAMNDMGDSTLTTNYELMCAQQNAHTQDVNSVAWNPKIRGLLASCSDDGDVKLWQIQEDQ